MSCFLSRGTIAATSILADADGRRFLRSGASRAWVQALSTVARTHRRCGTTWRLWDGAAAAVNQWSDLAKNKNKTRGTLVTGVWLLWKRLISHLPEVTLLQRSFLLKKFRDVASAVNLRFQRLTVKHLRSCTLRSATRNFWDHPHQQRKTLSKLGSNPLKTGSYYALEALKR